MKIRNGFVSNSSSTSFCIYGIGMDIDEIESYFNGAEGKTDEEIARLAKLKLNNDEVDFDTIVNKFERECGFSVFIGEESECYIGRDFTSIGDDETGREFKESTEKRLKDIFGDDIKVTVIEEVIVS